MNIFAAAALTVGFMAGAAQATVIDLTENSNNVTIGYLGGQPYYLSFTIDLPSAPVASGDTLSYDITFTAPFDVVRPYYGSYGSTLILATP